MKPSADETTAELLIAMERDALTLWCVGDPSGFLAISASDVAYFDPFVPRRLDGLPALTAYYESIRGQITADSFELLNPTVQIYGSEALLTYNFASTSGDAQQRWNCTEVYRRDPEGWRIIHTHWSMTAGTVQR